MATKKSRSRKSRGYHAAVRQIAKEENITIKEARKLYPYATVEVLLERPKRKTERQFLELSPGKFLEVKAGKPPKFENTFGPVRNISYVSKVQKLNQYWAFVHIMSEEWGYSIKATRKRIKKGLEIRDQNLFAYIYEVLGLEIKEYRRVQKMLRTRAGTRPVRRKF